MTPKKQIEAVAAVIQRGDKFLITLRMEASPMGHCWEFPGGKLEKGETIEQCAVRECQEEIAVTVRPIRLLKDVHYDYPHGHVFLHFMLCELPEGEPKLIQCRDAKWITVDEFKNYEFPPADIGVIEDLVKASVA